MARPERFRIEPSSTTVGRILRSPDRYFVPQYQRDYSWTDDETRELWEDVESLLSGRRKAHYLGAIVVVDASGDALEVVDGQQRLTSLSLLIMCIIEYLSKNNSVKLTGSFSALIDHVDPSTGDKEPKLKLNEVNMQVFESLHEGSDPKVHAIARNKSNKLLIKAKKYFGRVVGEFFAAQASIGTAAKSFDDAFNALHVTQIKVNDTESAFLIFETLNQRGLELSVSDLIKNHMLRSVQKGDDRSKVRRHWDTISQNVAEGDLTSFVRHYWLSKREVIRERDIFRTIKAECHDRKSTIQFSKDLTLSSAIYGSFQTYRKEAWLELSDPQKAEFLNSLEQINTCGVTQCYPVLLSALQVTPGIADQVAAMMLAFSFRYSIIGGGGTGNLEKFYSDVAKQIRDQKPSSCGVIWAEVVKRYPDDTQFKQAFVEKTERNGRIARYILHCISVGAYKSKEFHYNMSPQYVNLEHVLPQKPPAGSQWRSDFSADQLIDCVYRLGNLMLLEAKLNSSIENGDFVAKKTAYLKSKIRGNKSIGKQAKWTKDEIDSRQSWMAKKAAKIWSFSP